MPPQQTLKQAPITQIQMNPQMTITSEHEKKQPQVQKVKVAQNLTNTPKKTPTTSFKVLYSKYLKGKKPEESEDPDEKFECLSKIISYQACKIRNLEDRLKKIENLLPVYGGFDDHEEIVETEKSKKRKIETEEDHLETTPEKEKN